ncbi:MAG TPA: ATP synthase F1 subunit delta [Phycisphaerae bacterium]|nr:ATP synthase F1 subunit delta [Phycisphaerae bacterium]
MDVAAIPLADVYARALLELLVDDGQAEGASDELAAMVGLLDAEPDIERLLTVAPISAADRTGLISRAFRGRCSTMLANLLGVLARRDRLGLLRAISARFRLLLDRRQGKVEVTVRTAVELDEAQRQEVSEALARMLGAPPVLRTRVDPELIGGIAVTVEGRVYDASIGSQLEHMRRALVARAGEQGADPPPRSKSS